MGWPGRRLAQLFLMGNREHQLAEHETSISNQPSSSMLGVLYRAYTSTIASALITAFLLSSGFFIGMVSALGSEFLPLIHKQELLAEFVIGVLLPMLVLVATIRNVILSLLETYNDKKT